MEEFIETVREVYGKHRDFNERFFYDLIEKISGAYIEISDFQKFESFTINHYPVNCNIEALVLKENLSKEEEKDIEDEIGKRKNRANLLRMFAFAFCLDLNERTRLQWDVHPPSYEKLEQYLKSLPLNKRRIKELEIENQRLKKGYTFNDRAIADSLSQIIQEFK